MRAWLMTIIATFLAQGCVSSGPSLSRSHGVRQDSIGVHGEERREKRSGPPFIEVVVDAHDLGVRQEMETAASAALGMCKSIKAVDSGSDFVLRIIASEAQEPRFARQEPLRLRMLVVPTDADDPPELGRLRAEAMLEGNFGCLRRQAEELCRVFVTYVDMAMGMALEMEEDPQ